MMIDPEDIEKTPLEDDYEPPVMHGTEPVEIALELPKVKPILEQPEHDGEALGDFGETAIDSYGEVKPELLDEPEPE